jgi:transposase-like protein
MARHRKFTPEFKAQVVLEVISGAKSAAAVGRQYQLKPQRVSEWKATFLANAANAFQAEAQLRAGSYC